jgi:hypothetical protein
MGSECSLSQCVVDQTIDESYSDRPVLFGKEVIGTPEGTDPRRKWGLGPPAGKRAEKMVKLSYLASYGPLSWGGQPPKPPVARFARCFVILRDLPYYYRKRATWFLGDSWLASLCANRWSTFCPRRATPYVKRKLIQLTLFGRPEYAVLELISWEHEGQSMAILVNINGRGCNPIYSIQRWIRK